MRYVPLGLAVVGGALGIMTQYDILWSTVTRQRPATSDLVTVAFSIVGIAGGVLALRRPRAASVLMAVAVIGGLASAQGAYLAPAALFTVAAAVIEVRGRREHAAP